MCTPRRSLREGRGTGRRRSLRRRGHAYRNWLSSSTGWLRQWGVLDGTCAAGGDGRNLRAPTSVISVFPVTFSPGARSARPRRVPPPRCHLGHPAGHADHGHSTHSLRSAALAQKRPPHVPAGGLGEAAHHRPLRHRVPQRAAGGLLEGAAAQVRLRVSLHFARTPKKCNWLHLGISY